MNKYKVQLQQLHERFERLSSSYQRLREDVATTLINRTIKQQQNELRAFAQFWTALTKACQKQFNIELKQEEGSYDNNYAVVLIKYPLRMRHTADFEAFKEIVKKLAAQYNVNAFFHRSNLYVRFNVGGFNKTLWN